MLSICLLKLNAVSLPLGMTPGTTVDVVDRKGKGVMIVTVRGTRFAMGYNLTRNVDVTREVYHG